MIPCQKLVYLPFQSTTDGLVCDGVSVPAGARYARSAIVRAEGIVPNQGDRIEGALLVRDI